jgi:putative ABC transport system permease protein
MSLWSRLSNTFRGDKVDRELDEEFASHLEEAVAAGRDPEEAKRAFGSVLRQRERSREFRVEAWMDSLRTDAVFGWRQLMKRKVTTAAAVLSLGLAIGACTGAFRLVDALFLRPMPVSHPESLYSVSYAGLNVMGQPATWNEGSYPLFLQMRDAVKNDAEVVAAEYISRRDLTFGNYQQTEQVALGAVSGEFFEKLGLQPALGRLIIAADDFLSHPQPVAVLSYDYWVRRFDADPKVLEKAFKLGGHAYEIVGVAPRRFFGTQPGTMVEVLIPALMESDTSRPDSSSQHVFVRPGRGISVSALASRLDAVYQHSEKERAKTFDDMPKNLLDGWPNSHVVLTPAAEGVSELQNAYRPALKALSVLVGMVLLIACANIANLMQGQAATRAREMALRVSLGAGRARLVRMVMIESTMLAFMAAACGLFFAWWTTPFVVQKMSSPSNPVQLSLQPDWNIAAFGLLLTLTVTLLFGIMPALRASSVRPARVLKGGEEPQAQRAKMYTLIAAQVVFCFVVLFVAGLFMATSRQLEKRPLGFDAGRLLTMPTAAEQPQSVARWIELLDRLKALPGVKQVAFSGWSLLGGNQQNSFITVPGHAENQTLAYRLPVSPNWRKTMRISLLVGRDLRNDDLREHQALVNETFAKTYFESESPLGKTFSFRGNSASITVVGVVGDAVYRGLRERTLPQVYEPIFSSSNKDPSAFAEISSATLLVRTDRMKPEALEETLRKTVAEDTSFRVRMVRTQQELVDSLTIRERTLATLGTFFAGVALLLAAIGLYGVLSYSVLQRQKEFGVRIAIGASLANIAQLVTSRVIGMVLLGEALGITLGLSTSRYLESLLYGVKGSELSMLVVPIVILLGVALLAALPAAIRAWKINPVEMLRAE